MCTCSFLQVSYENVRNNVGKSFGALIGSQRKHHVVQDYLQFFETFSMERYCENPSYFLRNLSSMMNDLNNNALYLVASLVTEKKVKFEKTRLRMKKIIKDHLPNVFGESKKVCPTPIKELAQIFKDPSNFRRKQLTLLTPVSPSLLSSICKALEKLDEMPFQDLAAMNMKLRDVTVVPQFPPAKIAGKRELLLERVKKKCRQVLSNLKEGVGLPEPFAKALSIVNLSVKLKTRCMGIMTSEFYPFSPEAMEMQNDILGALWSLQKVRIHELKALQPLVDPEEKVPRKAFRIALRTYLLKYLFDCDVVAIPDEVSSILGSLNRRSQRRPRLFSAGTMEEDIEAALRISSHLKETLSNLLPDDKIDDNSEDLGSGNDKESNDFDLAEDSYYCDPEEHDQHSCVNDETEGAGDSSFASWTPMPTYPSHSRHLTDLYMIGDVSNKQPILGKDDSMDPFTDESHALQLTEACEVGDFIKKRSQLEQINCTNSSFRNLEHASSQFIKKSNVEDDDQNPHQSFPEEASLTCDLVKKSMLNSCNHIKPSQHCCEETLETTNVSKTVIQELCDETSLVAYRLIGNMLDKFLSIEGRDANEITRYYLRGGSSLDSPGTKILHWL